MPHGGDIYRNKVHMDFSVSLNPLPVPERIREALKEAGAHIAEYPDPEQERLREALARSEGIVKESVFAGNGASELLMASVRAFMPRRTLMIRPCYLGYGYALNSFPENRTEDYLLSEADGFALKADFAQRLTSEIDMLFLTDPWNPTGKNIDPEVLQVILKRAADMQITVILDQSFIMLSDGMRKSLGIAEMIRAYDQVIVIRSFTKFLGLPGIRMGCVMSTPENIAKIRTCLPEWNLSVQAEYVMSAGTGLLSDQGYMNGLLKQIGSERRYLTEALRELGCRVYRSESVFILFRSEQELFHPLLELGILIRDCSDFQGLQNGFYRIAVKDRESNRKLIAGIRKIINGNGIC